MLSKMIRIALVVVFGMAGQVLAGTVGFDPPVVVIDRTTDDPVFEIDLYVAETFLSSFNAAQFVVGSDDGLIVEDYDFGPGFCVVDGCGTGSSEVYKDALRIGQYDPLDRIEGARLGTLTVDTEGLTNGSYSLVIDYDRDGFSELVWVAFGVDPDPLYGSATVSIVPEPAALVLLFVGAVAGFITMRRSAPTEVGGSLTD